jgi:ABC-2 type transport system permease protein
MMSRAGKYLALGSATFQQRLAYRNVFLMDLAGQVMGLLSMYFLWKALYRGTPAMAGFSWEEMQTYLLLSFYANAVITWHSEVMMSHRILDGSVAIDLLKPLDYQTARFVETAATALIEGTSALAVLLLVALIVGIGIAPADPMHGLIAVVSFALGLGIKFGVAYLSGLACFWTTNGWGISWAQMAVIQLFAGTLVPITFFPGWLKTMADWLPFKGIVFTPVSIFMGKIPLSECFPLLLQQAAWAIALWMIGRVSWLWLMRKVTIHGG